MKKEEALHAKRGLGEKILFLVFFILFVLYALTLLYPMVWMFLSSLKGSLEYRGGDSAFALPKKWRFSNYAKCFEMLYIPETDTYYLGMVWNSLWMTGTSIVLGTIIAAAVCYVTAKLDFPGKKVIYGAVVLQMILPIYGTMASQLVVQKNIGIYDTPMSVVISAFAVGGTKFLILYSFFKGISWEYAEAAIMDGASHMTIFFKIMLPLAIAPLMTFAMTDFITGWNDYMSSLIYMPSYPTLATGLYRFEEIVERSGEYPIYFCGVILSALPVFVIFLTFRDTFMTSLSMGGLKG